MRYTFHIVDVFSSTPFGGNGEFNFGERTFVLPKNDAGNTCRVRIFTPRAEPDFAGQIPRSAQPVRL